MRDKTIALLKEVLEELTVLQLDTSSLYMPLKCIIYFKKKENTLYAWYKICTKIIQDHNYPEITGKT